VVGGIRAGGVIPPVHLHIKMIKKTVIIGIFLIINLNVNALQDSYITIKSNDINLCLSDYSNLQDYKCNGDVLQIEGTQDHVLYILPYTDLPKNNSNYNSTINYYMSKPIIWLGLTTTGLIIPLMFFISLVCVIAIFIKFIIPRR
jgi:hypothetical protein